MKPLLPRLNDMKYVAKPNLPDGRVSAAAVSAGAGEAIKNLTGLGIKVYKVFPDLRLPSAVNSHADMQLLHFGNSELFTLDEHLCTGELNKNFSLKTIGEIPGSEYPADVPLNAAIIGSYVICNMNTVSRSVLNRIYECGLTPIFVNQGYSKCSVCVIDENSIITDDAGIFAAAGNFFNDAQLISKGAVRLSGYNYGFFGGCCGKIAKDKLAVNGRIDSHPDCNKIIDFAERHSVSIIEVASERLEDIGGILPLEEYDT